MSRTAECRAQLVVLAREYARAQRAFDTYTSTREWSTHEHGLLLQRVWDTRGDLVAFVADCDAHGVDL